MLINRDWTQQGLRDLVSTLQEYYAVAYSPLAEGRAAAHACRALQHALAVLKADEGIHNYIRFNFPIGRHTELSIEERVEQAIEEFGRAPQVAGQNVNQVLECLLILLNAGTLKPHRPDRTLLEKGLDRLKGRPTEKQIKDQEENLLEDVGRNLDFLVVAYNHANP